MKKLLILLALVTVTLSCNKECDDFQLSNAYNDVCDILNSDQLDISCDEVLSFEGDVIGVRGKLDPDFIDYLNSFSPDFPDTWPAFFRILDSSTEEGDAISEAKFINEKIIQINLAHDGVSPSSFVPLKEELEVLFAGKAFNNIQVKGVARGVSQPTNATCDKGIVIELADISDVIID